MKLPSMRNIRNVGKAEAVKGQDVLVDDPAYLVDDPIALVGSMVDVASSGPKVRPVTIRPKMTR